MLWSQHKKQRQQKGLQVFPRAPVPSRMRNYHYKNYHYKNYHYKKCKQKIGVETPIDLLGCDAKNPVGEKKRHAKKKHITKQV